MTSILLTDHFVGLRRFRPEDVSPLFEAVQESRHELCTFMTWCRPDYSPEDCRSFVLQCGPGWEERTQYNLAIIDVRDQTLLGSIGLNRVDWVHRSANIGYWVRHSRARRGIATAATRLIAGFGLRELGLRRLELLIPRRNAASRRVAEKVGAGFEGILRKRLNLADGPQDACLYSLVLEDLAPAAPQPAKVPAIR